MVVVLGVLGGCSGGGNNTGSEKSGTETGQSGQAADPKTGDGGAKLDQAQANHLSSALFQDHEAGGANFVVSVPLQGATVRLTGRIDWQRNLGQAVVETQGAAGAVTARAELYFSATEVLERAPATLSDLLAAEGRPGISWLARPLNPSAVPLHVVLSMLGRLASAQRENPLLVSQAGAAYLRDDMVGNEPVRVYRYGDKTVYWVARDRGVVMRLEADLAVATATTTFDLSDHGPVTVNGPLAAAVVAQAEVSAELRQLGLSG